MHQQPLTDTERTLLPTYLHAFMHPHRCAQRENRESAKGAKNTSPSVDSAPGDRGDMRVPVAWGGPRVGTVMVGHRGGVGGLGFDSPSRLADQGAGSSRFGMQNERACSRD
ncbi:unnamed protein product [Sphagnum troendelagicum]|uniref:Uncharacterized protein n=1 Tax=Sphagnum troendelagicum TaxID=128251 RepID=A0ABP0U229_9BRYO